MTMNAGQQLVCLNNYSYQHLQGIMLVNLNRLAAENKLTHSEFRIMAVLIGFWNKTRGRAFPNTRMLAKTCCMSNSTIIKGLKALTTRGFVIILKDSANKRQNYFINLQKFLNTDSSTSVTPLRSTHDMEQKEIKQKNKIIPLKAQQLQKTGETSKIQYMVQFKCWKHKQTGKILQIKPAIGTHLLIKYFPKEEMVMFLDEKFTDYLDHFEPVKQSE